MGRTADNENGQERSTEMPRDVQKHQVRTPLQRRQRAAWGTLHRFQNSEEKSLVRYTGGEYDRAAEGRRRWMKLRRAQVPPLLGNCP